MEKKYHSMEFLHADNSKITVCGPIKKEDLAALKMHEMLKAFRQADEQKEALLEITELPEGRITVAIHNDTVVGYVTFHYPDEYERWSESDMEELIELGAIEVAHEYRGYGLAKKLMDISFRDNTMENFIVISTEYYWHWDLENTGLSVWDYRKVMEKVMSSVGMEYFATDDPEICSHPANMLMVRIGKNITTTQMEEFDKIRFKHRKML